MNHITRARVAIASFSVLLLLVVGFGTFNYFQSSQELPLLPAPSIHADVSAQPLLTYAKSLQQKFPVDISATKPSLCKSMTPGWLESENLQPGVAITRMDWRNLNLAQLGGSSLWINNTSVTCGDIVQIHASANPANKTDLGPRIFEVMRIGQYQGSGARVMWTSKPISLKYRAVPRVKTVTRTVATAWPTTTKFRVGRDWTPGLYLVVAISPSGNIDNVAPMILRAPDGSSKLLLVHSTMTWTAYNTFGGRSAYIAPNRSSVERSTVVSMDRPLVGSGANHLDRDAIALVQYLESAGISVDQVSDVDVSQRPSILMSYNGLVFSGHAEYMTRRLFDTILAARNQGINIAILGANVAYWQTRLADSPIGPNRKIEIYRNARLEPLTAPDQLTVQFQDPRINTPASLFTGEKTSGVHVSGGLKSVAIPSWLTLPAGAHINNWPVTSEIDGLTTGAAVPPNIHTIFEGKFRLIHNSSGRVVSSKRSLIANTIWYTSPSGSAVFAAGVNYWACELSLTCNGSTMDPKSRDTLQSITKQVLTLWQKKEVGKTLRP